MRAQAWLAVGLVLSVTLGCGDDDGAAPAETVTKLIGPEGGTVELAGGGKVTIPAGALTETTSIKVTKLNLDDVAPVPDNLEAAGKPYAFEPHGQIFAQTVKIEVPFEDDATEVRPIKLDDEDDTSWQTLVGSTKNETTKKLSIDTTSFSVILAVRPDRTSGVITLPDGAIVEDASIAGEGGSGGVGGTGGTGGTGGVGASDAGPDATLPDAGDDAGAMMSNLAQDAYIKADNSETYDNFGQAIALSGNTLVVGAPKEGSDGTGNNNNASGSGAAYVFVYTAGAWTQQAMLKAAVPQVNADFGWDVAIDGDTIVVGARYEDGANTDTGAAYVFVRNGTAWTQQATLAASNPGSYDEYGISVAVSGDTIAVGASREDSIATGVNNADPGQNDESWNAAGAVYVYTRSATSWSQQAYIKPSHPGVLNEWSEAAAKEFGYDVALDGDTLVVGAPGDDSNATGVGGAQDNNLALTNGAAYVFGRGSDGTWSEQAYLKTNDGMTFNYFGTFVAVSGDIVAVSRQDTNSYAGGVYTFRRNGSSWVVQQTVLGDANTMYNNFGSGIDLDGDRMIVSANSNAGSNTGVNTPYTCCAMGAGSVFELVLVGDTWTQVSYIKPSVIGYNDFFGSGSVAISGRVIAVGTANESSDATGINGDQTNDNALAAGAVYTFR